MKFACVFLGLDLFAITKRIVETTRQKETVSHFYFFLQQLLIMLGRAINWKFNGSRFGYHSSEICIKCFTVKRVCLFVSLIKLKSVHLTGYYMILYIVMRLFFKPMH